MKNSELLTKINELLSYAETKIGSAVFETKQDNVVCFSKHIKNVGVVAFRISSKHDRLYRECLLEIFNRGTLKDDYIFKTIKDKFDGFLVNAKVKGEEVSDKQCQRFIQRLLNAKKVAYKVFHKIYGLEIKSHEPIRVGCFSFYNFSMHKECLLKDIYLENENVLTNINGEFLKYDTWVCAEITTVDNERAKEIAFIYFEALQGVFQYILDLQHLHGCKICILRDVTFAHDECYIFSEETAHESFHNDITRHRIIDLYAIKHFDNGYFDKLLNRLFVSEPNQISRRLINAFTSYSRIMYEHFDTQEFALYITMIESLIGFDEANLADMLSGFLSALVSGNAQDYCATKDDFKRYTYDQRSEISHGARTTISKGDLAYAKGYAIELLKAYIADAAISQFSTSKDLKSYLNAKVKAFESLKED